jgi:hypothetical protein
VQAYLGQHIAAVSVGLAFEGLGGYVVAVAKCNGHFPGLYKPWLPRVAGGRQALSETSSMPRGVSIVLTVDLQLFGSSQSVRRGSKTVEGFAVISSSI